MPAIKAGRTHLLKRLVALLQRIDAWLHLLLLRLELLQAQLQVQHLAGVAGLGGLLRRLDAVQLCHGAAQLAVGLGQQAFRVCHLAGGLLQLLLQPDVVRAQRGVGLLQLLHQSGVLGASLQQGTNA